MRNPVSDFYITPGAVPFKDDPSLQSYAAQIASYFVDAPEITINNLVNMSIIKCILKFAKLNHDVEGQELETLGGLARTYFDANQSK